MASAVADKQINKVPHTKDRLSRGASGVTVPPVLEVECVVTIRLVTPVVTTAATAAVAVNSLLDADA
eukprot:6703618-Pyramimonas_sp.AAC.1